MIEAIFGFLFASGLYIGIAAFIYQHPEKTQKWLSLLFGVLSHIWKSFEYKAIKYDLQSRINLFVDALNSNSTTSFPKVVLKWVGREKEEVIWESGRVLLVMRDRKHSTKNLVHASYLFVSETLLRRSKVHLTKTQKISLDLFSTKLLLEKQSAAALEHFISGYFIPQLSKHDKISDYLKQFVSIQKTGLFFPILIQELSFLGNTIYIEKPSEEIIKEVNELVNFLERFSNRKVGDTGMPESFSGKYIRCAIRIIATKAVVEARKIEGRRQRLVSWIQAKYPNIYLIGADTKETLAFIKEIIEAVREEYPQLEILKSYKYEAEINTTFGTKIVRDVLMHLHYPQAVRHILSEEELLKEILRTTGKVSV